MIREFFKYIIYKFEVYLSRFIGPHNYFLLSRKWVVYCKSKKSALIGNLCYGNNFAVKRAMGKNFTSNCMIEHGVYFGRYVIEEECMIPEISTIYTYSPYRLEVLNEHFMGTLGKDIVPVGPYIRYARHFYSECKLNRMKRENGRTLLIFPTHSSPEINQSFDYNAWLNEIRLRAEGFDTVIISLYWLDFRNGSYKYYENKGYTLMCNGNRFDPFFLNRQKDLIYLADMTMSNDIGTHIGYCICENKPHYIYQQKIKYESIDDGKVHEDMNSRIRHQEYQEIFDAFSEFSGKITTIQTELVRYYWGI